MSDQSAIRRQRSSVRSRSRAGQYTALRSIFTAFALFTVGIFSTGCTEEAPDVLRVGLLPDQSSEELRKRYAPVFDRVAATAGIRYELVIPGTYNELVELFDTKKVDIAYFGGFTFAKAQKQSNARPLVMRDVDREFKSVLLVSATNPATSIEDLKGQSFSFGSRLSTSGHLMPRHFFTEKGIDAEKFFLISPIPAPTIKRHS